jgi:predicted MFS family arabinose efflux permease
MRFQEIIRLSGLVEKLSASGPSSVFGRSIRIQPPLAALIHYCATSAMTFFLSLYLQYIKGFSPENAGLILVSQPLVQAALSPFAGRLSDRIEQDWLPRWEWH